jgi:hypothetical protein
VTDEQEPRTISRQGTARALVLLASGFAVAGAALLFFGTLVFGPALFERSNAVVLGTAAFGVFVLVSVVVANLLAARARARSLGGVVGRGCGALLGGVVVGLGVMLLLISRMA